MAKNSSWKDLEAYVNKLREQVEMMPPPPAPDDAWSEKLSILHRTVQSLSEQLDGRIQAEWSKENEG